MMADPFSLFLEKYGSFTEIQEMAFRSIGSGSNCLVSAPTGSGKTEAVFLPVLKKAQTSENGIFALYITPLKALNRDLLNRLSSLSEGSGVSMAVRHGDTGAKERQRQAAFPPQVLVTTPETLQNLFLSKRLRQALSNVKVVVIDEVHELYYNKRGAQLAVALERLEELSHDFQRIGISATIGNLDETCRFAFGSRRHEIVASKKERDFEILVDAPVKAEDVFKIKDFFSIDEPAAARVYSIASLVKESEATIIFANTRQVVEALGRKLLYLEQKMGFGAIAVHHGSIDKEERISTESGFKQGKLKAIISTSSLELGMDIGRVDFVIQYGSPRQAVRLIQRIGRGGHAEGRISRGRIIVSGSIEALESAAIAELALKGRFEQNRMEENPYDVLLNQACGIALEYGRIDTGRMFGMVKRSSVFRNLPEQKFNELLGFAGGIGLLKIDGGKVGIGRRSRAYFYSNISVIPEVTRFSVKSVVSNKIISYLDEKFVYSNIEEGAYFISKGMPWKVLSIEDGVVSVEPGEKTEAMVPDWEGEDIPVSKDTVSTVLRYMQDGLGSADKFISKSTLPSVESFIKKQRKFFVPGPERLVIEELEDYAVVYTSLGKLGNEFLARLLSHVCSVQSGGRVAARANQYMILLDFGYNFRKPDVRKAVMQSAAVEDFDALGFVTGSDLFRYKFVKIATLFGIIDKGAKLGRGAVDRVMNFYEGSVVFDEVLRDLKKNYFDVECVREFASGLRSGRIKIEVLDRTGSPFTKETVQSAYSYSELLSPSFGREDGIEKLKERLGTKDLVLLCTFCGYAFGEKMAFDEDRKLACRRCGSPMLVIHSDEKEAVVGKRLSSRKMSASDSRIYSKAVREAGLINEYGNRAAVALSVYGIGVDTAARILRMLRKDYKEFFVDVIEEQRKFVKNRRFWSG